MAMALHRLLDALMIYVIVWSILLLTIWMLYIVQGIALYKISKQNGFKKWWLSWIPIVHFFVIPLLAEHKVSTRMRGKFITFFGVTFVISAIVFYVTSNMCFLSIALIPLIYSLCVIMKPYSKHYRLHAWLAILSLGISIPFQLLRFSRKDQLI